MRPEIKAEENRSTEIGARRVEDSTRDTISLESFKTAKFV